MHTSIDWCKMSPSKVAAEAAILVGSDRQFGCDSGPQSLTARIRERKGMVTRKAGCMFSRWCAVHLHGACALEWQMQRGSPCPSSSLISLPLPGPLPCIQHFIVWLAPPQLQGGRWIASDSEESFWHHRCYKSFRF